MPTLAAETVRGASKSAELRRRMKSQIPRKSVAALVPLIRLIREQRVMLDADLANLYEVQTKQLNQQLQRNRGKFPSDFAFQLTAAEWGALRSQFVTLKAGRGQHRKYLPYVFTEYGALQAANVWNSARASAMSIYIIRALVKMREDLAANATILKRLAEIDRTLLTHDAALRKVLQDLRPLLKPAPPPPKPQIGFHVKEDAVPYRTKRKPRSEEARAAITSIHS
jgi:hypothetical protein